MFKEIFSELNIQKRLSILLFALEDTEIVNEALAELSPSHSLTVITKKDIIGKSIGAIIKEVRRAQYDIFVVSNRFSQVRRSHTVLRLLAIVANAKHKFAIHEDGTVDKISPWKVFFSLLPNFLVGIPFGFFLIVRSYWNLFWLRNFKPLSPPARPLKKIAFLRTDLGGSLAVGGSVSHILGFLKATTSLGVAVRYCSDAAFGLKLPIAIEQSIVPSSLFLDFFDEFVLLDYNFRMVKALKESLHSWNPTVVYQRHSVLSLAGVHLSKKLHCPLYLEVNGSEVWARQFWGRLILRSLAQKMETASFQSATRIFVVSKAVRDQIIALGADARKIIVNPNGVDTNSFHPSVNGESVRAEYKLQNKTVVGFVGTFLKAHGVEILIESAALLLQRHRNLHFLLVGAGPLKSELELRVQTLQLQKSITFAGIIAHNHIPQQLAACDILVSPHTALGDGTRVFFSPIKLFEYMAMGKPIVASRVEQIGEIIIDGENGLLAIPGSASDLAEKIELLTTDRRLRKKLGARARRDTEEKYTWKQNAQRVLEAL